MCVRVCRTTTFRRVCFDKVKVMKESCLSEASTTVGKLDDYEVGGAGSATRDLCV